MEALLKTWLNLEGRTVGEGVCRPELLSQTETAAHLALAIRYPGKVVTSFYLDVWAKRVEGCASPYILLNTRVDDPGGGVRESYRDILLLLREVVPARTPLATFVRQRDSLNMLEEDFASGVATNPSTLPLVELFTSSSWQFLKLSRLAEAQNPKRRWLIRFETLP